MRTKGTTTLTAAATMSLSGAKRLQGRQAARGLELWAADDDVHLRLIDDAGSPDRADRAYQSWLEDDELDLILGPYGSNLVRSVGPITSSRGRLLWNHGGSADDLVRPLVVPVATRASTYFHGAVELAVRRGLEQIVLIRGAGRFARAVASGTEQKTDALGVGYREVSLAEWPAGAPVTGSAVLVVGTFDEDVALAREILAKAGPALLACVAAGLPEFGARLGSAADGVVGPVQWLPGEETPPEVGPSGVDFARMYRLRYGEQPGYVAAQAAAAGYLAAESKRRQHRPDDVRAWTTTTLLGGFALDDTWRQVGHRVMTVEWREGRQRRVDG